MHYDELSFDEKVGQRFIFGVNSNNIDSIIDLIKNYYIGGVILYKKNYSSYEEMVDIIKRLKTANKDNKIPLFIAIDQEGGKVNRMPKEIHNLKNIYDISKTDPKLVYESANIMSKMLSESGINMNFAPVIDIYNNSKSKVLYKRCFYGDYDDIMKYEIEYIDSFKKNNIISSVKHFPGHGSTLIDSHFWVPYVFNYKDVLSKHILPFEYAIKHDVHAIMVGHLVIRRLTHFLPASISKRFIDDYLIDKYHFNGLIITDEINMLRRNIYRFVYLKKALNTPSDIILIKIKDDTNGYNIINKYKTMLNDNINLMESLNNSIKKIIDIKEKYNVNDNVDFNGCNIVEINKKIDEINSKVIDN